MTAKDPENRSYPETLAEAYNLTIYWEGNRKSYNRNDHGRDVRSVNFYNNGGRGRGNNNRDKDKTTTMIAILTQARDYVMEKHVMEDA